MVKYYLYIYYIMGSHGCGTLYSIRYGYLDLYMYVNFGLSNTAKAVYCIGASTAENDIEV